MKLRNFSFFRRSTERHIRFRALLHMALANLRFKRFRSAITIIGIAIGTGSVFILLSFGLGLQELVAKQISEGQSINTIDVSASGSRVLKIDSKAVRDLAVTSHVQGAGGFFANAGKLTVGGASADVVVYGIDALYLQTSNLVVSAGLALDPSDETQVVVSESILNATGITDARKAVGTKVRVAVKLPDGSMIDKSLTISGVVSSGSGSEAFVSSKFFSNAGSHVFAGAKVLVDDREYVDDVRRVIEGYGYQTTSPIDTLDQVEEFFRIFRIILVGFGAIGMTIAILGMVNTLTVSLLERTREVALMFALGARPRDMRRLFILESIALSLGGGIVGIVFSLLLGGAIDVVLNGLARTRGAMDRFSVFAEPWWLILLTLVFMAAVGYLVAYIPARRASRINSIEALRRE